MAAGAVGGFLLVGCGGGSVFNKPGEGGGGFTLRKRSLAVNPAPYPLADEDGLSIHFLGSFTDNGIQAAYWGSQAADGKSDRIRQALVWDTDATIGARARYDDRGMPMQIVNQANGAFATSHWESDAAVLKFYQADGAYIGGAKVTGTAPNFTLAQLEDSMVVGYFSGSLQGATDGIFAVTVGGVQQPMEEMAMPMGVRGPAVAQTRAETTPDTYRTLLEGLKTASSGVDLSPFAQSMLAQLATEYGANGKSALFERVLTTALASTGLSGLFPDSGRAILRGLVAQHLLQTVSADFAAADPATLVQQGNLTTATSSPGFTGYLGNDALPEANPNQDRTLVSGVVVAREFGAVALHGYIDASGRLSASGTTNGGTGVELIGTVNGDQIAGNWSSTPSTRGSGGLFDGLKQLLGQCMEQQNSGGQGTYTNSYDLQKCGDFPFAYDAYTIPDQFIVLNGTTKIYDTGSISGGATVSLHVSGASTIVTVIVVASLDGTAWEYTVGCPA